MIAPRAGVSATSYAKGSTFAAISGAWDTGYPVANLGDLVRSAQPARVTPASGAAAFSAVMAAAQTVQIAALVHHTLPDGATIRLRLYSDAAMSGLVYDSGLYGAWPQGSAPSSGYMATRPFITDAPVLCRAARIDLAGLTGSTDIGAFELAKWWEWPGVSPGANIGFSPTQGRIDYIGGASEGVDEFLPRTYDAEISLLDLQVAATQGIDFQKTKGLATPFVFVEDYNDQGAWPRTCFLARNNELPALVGALYRHDKFQFRFKEHLR